MSLLLLFNQGSTPTISSTALISFTETTATYALVGDSTSWSGSTTFSLTNARNASVTSKNVLNSTHATIVVTFGTPPNMGPYLGTDGTSSFNLSYASAGSAQMNQMSAGMGIGIF